MLLRRIVQRLPLGSIGAELEASGRGVREWMMEDVQRSLVLLEDELEVFVVRGVATATVTTFVDRLQNSLTMIPLLSRDASSVHQVSSVVSDIS